MWLVRLWQTNNYLKLTLDIFQYDVFSTVLLQLNVYSDVSRGIFMLVYQYRRPSSGTQKRKIYIEAEKSLFSSEECKRYSFCCTPARKLQNLQPAASKNIILRLRHHQDSQVAIYIDLKL